MKRYVVQPQNLHIITAHTINRDVIFVQNQLTRPGNSARPAHARMKLKLGHSITQLNHKTAGPRRIVFGDVTRNFIHRT